MGRRFFNSGNEIVAADLLGISQALESTILDQLLYEVLERRENAFFGDSLTVSYASANSVTVKKGLGIQSDVSQVAPESQKRIIYLATDVVKTISTPDATLGRIDIVCVKSQLADQLTESRKIKDAISDEITTANVVTQKNWSADVIVVAGVPNAVPVAPAVPAGYVKIAQLTVAALTGMSGVGAVADSRTKMPIGSQIQINTTGFNRLSVGTAKEVQTLMAEIDALLYRGRFNYIDLDDSTAPGSPAAGKVRIYSSGGVRYVKDENGIVSPLGSGGGGAGAPVWYGEDGNAPIHEIEFGTSVFKFEKDAGQKLICIIPVPANYIAGRQITAFIRSYSPGSSLNYKFQVVSTLIRKNLDAMNSTTNQETVNSGDILNTAPAYRMRQHAIAITSSLGIIGTSPGPGVPVAPLDTIKLELTRITPTGSEDLEDMRFVPSLMEVTFS